MEPRKCKEENIKFNNKIKKNINSRVFILLTTILLQILLVSCKQTNQEPISKTAFALDTMISITLYDSDDEEILDSAMELVNRYEGIYSRTISTSELSKLNNRELLAISDNPYVVQISDELREIIDYGLQYSELSQGKFDIAIGSLTSLWDFKTENPKIPEQELISQAIKNAGYDRLMLEDNIITLQDDGTIIELGAIAKGYIADKVKEYLLSEGIKSAIINLGGNVLCLGEKPNNEPFKIGIQKPFAGRNEIVATMDIKDMSIVTSGIYERFFNIEEKTYHHILNPETGFPYENNLISVTIISPKSVDGDGLSTTCFALGLNDGMELVNNIDGIHAIFITKDYEFHYTDGFFEDIEVIEAKGIK